jgi:hypothetical protein
MIRRQSGERSGLGQQQRMEDGEERRPGRQRPPSREQEAREEGQRGRRSTDGNRNRGPTEQERSAGERIGDRGESSENPLKALKILYANAQSIVGKIGELTAVMQDIEPDLILLTETWCNSTIPDAFLTLEGYRLETDLR